VLGANGGVAFASEEIGALAVGVVALTTK